MNSPSRQVIDISKRRSQYPFHERLIVYDTESMQRMLESKNNTAGNNTIMSSSSQAKNSMLMVNGVNILNKNSVDSDTAMRRIIQRRKTHNKVERRRRDRMNNLFKELLSAIPSLKHNSNNTNRAEILQEATEYIKRIQKENHHLRSSNNRPPAFEDDDSNSLFSCGSSLISSPPSNSHVMFTPSPSFVNNISGPPLIYEPQRSIAPIRPQHQYESIISFH